MTDIKSVVKAINSIAPEDLQEEWDNSGIQISTDTGRHIGRIMTCLEISDAIVDEAIEREADLIVTHHPLFFKGYRSIDADDIIGGQVCELIKHGISVYSSHTAFDSALKGTNQYIAEAIGLSYIEPLVKDERHLGCGMGRWGGYSNPIPYEELVDRLGRVCTENTLRQAGKLPFEVNSVALCTGAGSEFIDKAAELGCDVFITGDLKYHDARHAADIGLCVIDAGHYGTEIQFAENMAGQLKAVLGDEAEVFTAKSNINPFIENRRRS